MKTIGGRAVVIGSGIAGLAAAAGVAAHFDQVVILERDEIPPTVRSRPGTPQDRHPHGLLAGGLRTLDEMLPGFRRELHAAGAVSVSIADEFRIERPDIGAFPARDFGLTLLFASRPLIEAVLRRRVLAIGNVELRQQCRVVEILKRNKAVCGIRFDGATERSQTLDCDLVVDASGRAAPTLALLDALGQQRPDISEANLEICYSTAIVRFEPGYQPDWKVVLTEPDPPRSALRAGFAPREDGRWFLTIADHRGLPRLETWDDFVDTCSRLKLPTLSNFLRHARSTETIRHFVFSGNRWQHFERLHVLPHGVLPIGDSLCRLSPTYGQGMASAIKQAQLLQDMLDRATEERDPIAAAQAAFMRNIPAVVQAPWDMATGIDLAFPQANGERPEHFEEHRRFEESLMRAAVADSDVHRAVLEVAQLLESPSLFGEPHIRQKIERYSERVTS